MLSSVMLIPNLNTLNLDVIPLDVIPGRPFRRYSFRRYSRPYNTSKQIIGTMLCVHYKQDPTITGIHSNACQKK